MSSVNFIAAVKIAYLGLNFVSLELWGPNDGSLAFIQQIGYLDGNGRSNFLSTNYFSTADLNESLYGVVPEVEPPLLAEESDSSSTIGSEFVEVSPFYVPGNQIVTGNYLVFVCNVVTVDINGMPTSDGLKPIPNFNGSSAIAHAVDLTATMINPPMILGESVASYVSTPFPPSDVTSNPQVIIGDNTPQYNVASIAFAFPFTTGEIGPAEVSLIIDSPNF